MKAILVFDVDNMNIDIENTQATYIELQCNDIIIQMALVNHWLKPIPDKDEGYGDGWDACINEILGGNE